MGLAARNSPTEANIISRVFERCRMLVQYQHMSPPTVRAKVKDGTLYMPILPQRLMQNTGVRG